MRLYNYLNVLEIIKDVQIEDYFNNYVSEIFNSSLKIKILKKTSNVFITEFEVEGIKYNFSVYIREDEAIIQFYPLNRVSGNLHDQQNKLKYSGKVFSAVFQSLDLLLKNYKNIDYLGFTVENKNLEKIYDKLDSYIEKKFSDWVFNKKFINAKGIVQYGYIKKESKNELQNIITLIKKDCQPFLKDWKKLNINSFLYSGRKEKVLFKKKKVRSDRVPRNTPKMLHGIFDNLFYKKFGIKARSNSIFCSFSEKEAKDYGKIYCIFPIGNYIALSSKTVYDLTMDFSNRYGWTIDYDKSFENAKEFIEKNKYTKGLEYHLNEIMINCKEYYMVNFDLKEFLLEELKNE